MLRASLWKTNMQDIQEWTNSLSAAHQHHCTTRPVHKDLVTEQNELAVHVSVWDRCHWTKALTATQKFNYSYSHNRKHKQQISAKYVHLTLLNNIHFHLPPSLLPHQSTNSAMYINFWHWSLTVSHPKKVKYLLMELQKKIWEKFCEH